MSKKYTAVIFTDYGESRRNRFVTKTKDFDSLSECRAYLKKNAPIGEDSTWSINKSNCPGSHNLNYCGQGNIDGGIVHTYHSNLKGKTRDYVSLVSSYPKKKR